MKVKRKVPPGLTESERSLRLNHRTYLSSHPPYPAFSRFVASSMHYVPATEQHV